MKAFAGDCVKIKYGVIPAAGKGTRMGLLTRAVPKELLPVGGKPSIQYAVEAMALAGIEKIFIITGWKKHAVLDFLGSGKEFGVDIAYVVQDNVWGLSKAIAAVEPFIDEPFLTILGDDIFYGKDVLPNIMADHHRNKADATIGIEYIENMEEISRFGVIMSDKNNRIVNVIEKPKPDIVKKIKCRDVACGIYVFDKTLFDAIKETKPGVNGEYQLADATTVMIKRDLRIFSHKIHGKRITIGSLEDVKKANRFFDNGYS